jgi:hypothetical protein
MPVSREFHVMIGGAASGPFPLARLAEMAREGSLKPTDYVRGESEAAWVPASTVLGSPPPVPVASEPPIAVLRPPIVEQDFSYATAFKILAVGSILVAAFYLGNSAGGPMEKRSSFWECVSLSLFACAISAIIYFRRQRPWRIIAAVSVVAAYWIYCKVDGDTYRTHYTDPQGNSVDEVRMSWGDRPAWRSIHEKVLKLGDDDDIFRWSHREGPLSPSGREHGKWTWRYATGPATGWERTYWYWYGDEVTEGEWMLRSKD